MAIQFYIGSEGSGKTYQVVTEAVREALKQGRRVFTNIPAINADLIIQHIKDHDFTSPEEANDHVFGTVDYFRSHEIIDNQKFYPDLSDRNFTVMSDLGDLSQYRVQAGDLFIIDECFEIYHREKKLSLYDETFFRKHRKYVSSDTDLSTEIIIMTQDKDACNKHLLSTVTTTYWATKKEEIGQPNRFNIDIFKGLPKYREKPYKQIILQKYDPEKFSWYRSHGSENAKQESVDKRQSAFGKKQIITMSIFPILLIGLLIYGYNRFSSSDEKEPATIAQNSPSNISSTTNKIASYATGETEQSTDFYITGIYYANTKLIVYMSDGYITKTVFNPTYYKWGRTYNIEVNGKWYTNYSYTQLLHSDRKQR